MDDAVQDDIRADLRAAFKTKTRDEWAAQLTPADTCVAPVPVGARTRRRSAVRRRAARSSKRSTPPRARFRQVGPVLAGQTPPDGPYRLRDATETDVGGVARPRPGFTATEIDELRARRSGGVTDLPADVEQLIDVPQYAEVGEFPVEQGYIWTSCASVENGNPLFWDDDVATEITGGPIAPPTMVSVWFRPHHWRPGRTEPQVPLQSHFDLKARFDLPEAVMSDNTLVFHEPVRVGDRLRTHQVLRSVSDEKTTKLGTGRFWVIDVVYHNQRDELVCVESYTGFGYRRDA